MPTTCVVTIVGLSGDDVETAAIEMSRLSTAGREQRAESQNLCQKCLSLHIFSDLGRAEATTKINEAISSLKTSNPSVSVQLAACIEFQQGA